MRRYCAIIGLSWASPAIAATLNGNRREVETKFTGKDAFHSVPDPSLSRFRKWDAEQSVLTAAVTDRLAVEQARLGFAPPVADLKNRLACLCPTNQNSEAVAKEIGAPASGITATR